MSKEYKNYEVHVTYQNDEKEYVGMINLPEIITIADVPTEIEIDGVVYYPQI